MHGPRVWDLFCTVIDNHGDLGVCWRLAADLAMRGERVRLWVDDASALAWMAPQGCPGVEVRSWDEAERLSKAPVPETDVLIEAFGCEIPEAFLAATVAARSGCDQPAWINLEYLSAEAYVERSHGLPSPVMSGPARGWTKRFFYPGFTARTGGLLRETDLLQRQQDFNADPWLAGLGVHRSAPGLLASMFCYEPAALPCLLDHWTAYGHLGQPVTLLVTAGRAAAAVRAWQTGRVDKDLLQCVFLPYLSQIDFDHLLWACDLNLVRGEDSLVRALWAGKPVVWQLYPQEDDAHLPKLQAFLDTVQAPPVSRQWHSAWNPPLGVPTPPRWLHAAEAGAWHDWREHAKACRLRLQGQSDLASQLLGFLNKTS